MVPRVPRLDQEVKLPVLCEMCVQYLVTVLLHSKVGAAMLYEHVILDEGVWIQQ